MQRRKFIASIGSVAAGAAAVTGTGAFTNVNADRSVAVEVADDNSAFLAISKDRRNGSVTNNASEYIKVSDGTVSLDFTTTDAGATGINDNATTGIEDLLAIENRGSQGVYVGYTHPASPTGGFALFHEDKDFRGPGGGDNYDASSDNYNNDGQLNIKTAPDADNDDNPDLVFLNPGDKLEHIGLFFFGSPDPDAISNDPVTFRAVATFDELPQ